MSGSRQWKVDERISIRGLPSFSLFLIDAQLVYTLEWQLFEAM